MQRPLRPFNHYTIQTKGISYDALTANQFEWNEYNRQVAKFQDWFKHHAHNEVLRLADTESAKVICKPATPAIDAEPIAWFIYETKLDSKLIHDRALALIEARKNPTVFNNGEMIDNHDRWYGQGDGRRSGD